MNTANIPSWLECVDLHPDVLSTEFSESMFALDLGLLSDYLIGCDMGLSEDKLKSIPPVYRDPESFFRVSFLTAGLQSLLRDILGRLAGLQGERIIKLVTPFGGGKSHTLAALLHGVRSREALDVLPEVKDLSRPGKVRIAVIDGQSFDAVQGKSSPDGRFAARTIWGWIAWALAGSEGYEIVREQDEARVSPGSDTIAKLLEQGPSLILLDEMLEYLISAGGLAVEKTTLRDETLSFLKRLTVAVDNTKHAALVFSLPSSKRESLEYDNILRTLEHLTARKDQRREPVAGNEILNVIQRRLLAKIPDTSVAKRVADIHAEVFTHMRRAYGQSDSAVQQADEEGIKLRDRIIASYPFHPSLIDIMQERWAAIPDFQRTRGALRFLASCLRSVHKTKHSRMLLGPGDVPLSDDVVRLAFFKEVGQREDFQPCLVHDFIGANSRTREIDEKRERQTPSEIGQYPATRLATTILMYSFGGLSRDSNGHDERLPSGIGEMDLLRACVAPDLNSTTIQACIKELKERCLYLHFDGTLYCFKKDPNVTLLIEQEAENIARNEDLVRAKIKEMMEERLAKQPAILWPSKSDDIRDDDSQFLIVYMPLEFSIKSKDEQSEIAKDMCANSGKPKRNFQNGLGLAIPSSDQTNHLQRSVRYFLATERIQSKWRELNLTSAQKSQLHERNATERTTIELVLLKLYNELWLPKYVQSTISMESVNVGGIPLSTKFDEKKRAQIHQRLMELLRTQRKIFDTITPTKIVELFNLNDDSKPGIYTKDIVAGFFSFLGFPRLDSCHAIHKAIITGVKTGTFGYAREEPHLGEDGHYNMKRSNIFFEKQMSDDEIDLELGFLIMPKALPPEPTPEPTNDETGMGPQENPNSDPPSKSPQLVSESVDLSFTAREKDLYNAWTVIANLAKLTGTVAVSLKTTLKSKSDKSAYENNVLEPLRELGLVEDDK